MKKKIIAISLIVLLATAVVWMVIEGSSPEVLPLGSKLPEIEYSGFSGVQKLKADNVHKTVVMFFSEECSHCIYELNLLNNNLQKLKRVNVYLITIEKDVLKNGFIDNYQNLKKADNVTFGIVKKEEYKSKLGIMSHPVLYFFNEKGKLTSKIKGETKIEKIIECKASVGNGILNK